MPADSRSLVYFTRQFVHFNRMIFLTCCPRLRSIAETHFQLGVAQAHSGDYVSAEKSLRAAISVLNARISNLKKMEVSENITKELSDLETLIYEIKERTSDHKEMQRGTYKEDKDFVPMYNGILIVNTLYDSYSFSFQISRRSSRGSPRSPPSPLFCLVTMIIAT